MSDQNDAENRDEQPEEEADGESGVEERSVDEPSAEEEAARETPVDGPEASERSEENGDTEDADGAEMSVSAGDTDEPVPSPEDQWDGNLEELEEVEREDLEGESVLPIRREFVEDLLLELGQIAESRSFHSLYEEVHDERIPALRQGEMSVVVLGEFNHGKSTVVNALLGEEILPVGITPTTSVITHLVHAEQPQVTVHPTGGEEPYEIGYDEMSGLVTEEDQESGEEPDYVETGYPNELLADNLVLPSNVDTLVKPPEEPAAEVEGEADALPPETE